MSYNVNFFDGRIFIDMVDENGDFVATYREQVLPEGETAKMNVIETFKYIAHKKELGEF